MQSIDETKDFGKRAAAINAQWKVLARRAGVAPSTALRFANSETGGGRIDTARKLMGVLEAEEIRMALHLAALPHVQAALAAQQEAAE